MILTDVRRHLRDRGPASARVLAEELRTDLAIVEAALDYWQDRGNVRPCTISLDCGTTCRRCPVEASSGEIEAFEWCSSADAEARHDRS